MADGKLKIEFEGDLSKLRSELKKVLGDAHATGAKGGKGLGAGFSQGFKDAFSGFTAANLAMRGVDASIAMVNKGIDNMLAKESALADFSAITGVTGSELAKFGEAATDLSNKFGTSTVENIESFKGVLSRLGPDFASSTEAVKLMGENINLLAAASGLGATESMDALTTAMLQFGVDLSDPIKAARESTRMMNEMAAGAKEGAAEIPQIAESLKQVGSTAKSLNISSLEVNAFIQTLAMGGKTGSEAGIALRNVLTSMIRETGPAAEALGRMGLSSQQLGTVLTSGPGGANNALKLLRERLEAMSGPAERNAALVKIFGVENLAAAQTMISLTSQTDKLTTAMKGTNTTLEQAKINLDTTESKWKRFSAYMDNTLVGALENMKGRLAEAFGGITGIFEGKNVFDSLQDVLDPNAARVKNLQKQKQIAEMEKKQREKEKKEKAEAERIRKEEEARLFGEGKGETGKPLRATLDELVAKRDELEKSRGKLFEGDIAGARKLDAQIAAISKRIDALNAPKKGRAKTKKEDPLVGTVGALAAELKLVDDQLRDKLVPGSDAFITASLKASALRREIELLNRSMQVVTDVDAIGLVAVTQSVDTVLDAVDEIPVIDMSEKVVGIDALGTGIEALGLSLANFGDLFSAAFSGGEDAMKMWMKAIGSQIIDFIEAEYVAAGAAVAIRALLSGGFSLAWDTAGYLGAGLLLEAARGALNSLDTGGMLKTDQAIRAHRDETIIPYDAIPDIWARVLEKTGTTQKKQTYRETYRMPRTEPTSGTMRVSYRSLGSGMRDAEIHQSRRVG